MIVDCHTHISLAGEQPDISDHLAAAETVDFCIVLAEPGSSSAQANNTLSEYIREHGEKMIGFGLVDPLADDVTVKALESMKRKLGLKGAVIYCASAGFHPAHTRAMAFYDSAQQVGLPVFFHNAGRLGCEAVLDYAQPVLIDEVARTFPQLKCVLGNMGMPFIEQTLAVIAKHENVYADLTIESASIWQIYNTIVAAYERRVMNKLLFGSGFPEGNAGQCIERLLGFNKLLADTNLPTVPRGNISAIVERDTLDVLGIK